jgi:hypothetical protein
MTDTTMRAVDLLMDPPHHPACFQTPNCTCIEQLRERIRNGDV